MDKTKTYYLAGPMRGYENFNLPAFEAAAQLLRDRGYMIISPAEINALKHHMDVVAAHAKRSEYLRNDIRCLIDECRGIILLPGWSKSRGAQLESNIAVALDYEIRFLREDGDLV